MKKVYSKKDPKRLLHMVFNENDFSNIEIGGRKDIVDEKEFIQLSALKMRKNKTFRPHKHIWKSGEKKVIAQESWVVIKGQVECVFSDTDGTFLANPILNPGDCSITLGGGHTYKILEEDTLVYEFKTGPYKGVKKDKVFLDEI